MKEKTNESVFQDVKLTATNDDQYFVFEDFLYQVISFNFLNLNKSTFKKL